MPIRNKQHKSAYDRERYARLKSEWLRRTNARHNAVRQAIRDVIIAYLAKHPCVDCAEADPVVLDFDHVRGEKSFSISAANNRLCSIDRLLAEIAKCEIRCSNCHRRKTHRERGHRCKLPRSQEPK